MLDYLGGEKAVCSGCDVCDARQNGENLSYKAEDAEIVLKFIRKNRRLYTREEATGEIEERLNKRDLKTFGVNIWEAKDISEIFSQLLAERKIKVCGFLWKNRLDISNSQEKSSILRIIPKCARHRLFLLRNRFGNQLLRLQSVLLATA